MGKGGEMDILSSCRIYQTELVLAQYHRRT